ncbi:AarF/ABC1/UbiB kinase family protein [Maribacter algarum]|uniref:AarF/ABC1/UbiB kinase family protein n=1 Tax=Maribacter algarum (ex Zhang et al. 2020) TaxID=2578118 RepID=A0A5S3PNC9_9FLAO|nr:AarF/ABC1/UbiB kinase family protein [Maribacter algarum]TMM55999.1 AarF/ABC1/UbiB kinase family protein [Maribacter algarum]
MKTLDKIPTGKIERASKLMKTGVKIGGNYVKYYGKKLVNPELTKEQLNEDNAEDIYDGLKTLKGSALKVAQMLSMEKNMLPRAYVDKFSLSQFSVPPLSAPLVRKTFKKYLGKYPEEIYDTFENDSINAASIGQVHKATKDGKELAVKIQYPGVAESISSDLALVKPIALKMFNINGKDSDKYFKEVENKLFEETDYLLELAQSKEITESCSLIEGLKFPKYYENLSSERIITMDWMNGVHLSEFAKTDFPQELGDKLGQTLWDFYMYQIHILRKVHADPHPGNFLVGEEGNLIAIDFGCIKEVPDEFYVPYFELSKKEILQNDTSFIKKMYELEILTQTDTLKEIVFFKSIFKEMLTLFTAPLNEEEFDFGADEFWNSIAELSDRFSKDTEIRKMNGNRGSKHFLYMNRTFFGLFNLLHDLKANVKVNNFKRYLD